jgi:S-adenosylmethionine:tRNA ribosyltransferase-isomerase
VKTSDFNYYLPASAIAQTPIEPRHASRLLVLHRSSQTMEHATFWDIGKYLHPGDLLVINQTRVIPARIYARKQTGGKVELLLIKRQDSLIWEALVGGKRITPGARLNLEGGREVSILQSLGGARRLVQFSEPVEEYLQRFGQMPLPPYIHAHLENPERYQTIYAQTPGSAAAPTAGLHFTQELIERLKEDGVDFASVILHVGLDTFAPVDEEDPTQHVIHSEWCEISLETAQKVNRAWRNGGRIIAVGTTSVRALETAATDALMDERISAWSGSTRLFILPGHSFKAVDALVTNFHLPRSTLLMLVSAFAGREFILDAYQEAVKLGYRFYSFGDAMLIL